MCQKLIIADILHAVAEVTDIPVERIISHSRQCEVVDARHICVYLLLKRHVPKHKVAEIFSTSIRNIYYIIEEFNDRRRYGDPMIEVYISLIEKSLK